MKIAILALFIVVASAVLWYLSGIIFLIGMGSIAGFIIGIPTGWVVNDWFEGTRVYKWRQKRRARKMMDEPLPFTA